MTALRTALTLSLTGAVLLSLAACAPEPGTTPTPSAAPSAAATPAPSESPEPSTAPTPHWDRVEDAALGFSVEVPTGWSTRITERAAEEGLPAARALSLADRSGTIRLVLSNEEPALGWGDGEAFPAHELDRGPLSLPDTLSESDADVDAHFAYRAVEYPGGVSASLGLTSVAPGIAAGDSAFRNVLRFPSGAIVFADTPLVDRDQAGEGRGRSFASLAEAKAFMLTDEYLTLKRALSSLTALG